MRPLRAGALALALLASTGCASVLSGGRTTLEARVVDAPPGVAIRVNGLENRDRQVFYAASARAELDRASAYIVIAEAPGYQAAERVIHRRPSFFLLADALLGVPFVLAGWPMNVRPFPGGPDVLSATGVAIALGAVGLDVMSGAAWMHADRRVVLRLAKAPPRP